MDGIAITDEPSEPTEPSPPSATEDIAVDIHKPKPVHNLREFLSEIGVIVIGVLIALAGEQGVEWWHWRHQIAETRETLDHEIARDLGAIQYRIDAAPCIDRRLSELQRLFAAQGRGQTLSVKGPISQPNFPQIGDTAWQSAQAAGVLAHMSVDQRLKYSRLYAAMAWVRDRTSAEGVAWSTLVGADDIASMTPQDLAILRAARAQAQGLAAKVDANLGAFRDQQGQHHPVFDQARLLGVDTTPFDVNPASAAQQAAFCAPML